MFFILIHVLVVTISSTSFLICCFDHDKSTSSSDSEERKSKRKRKKNKKEKKSKRTKSDRKSKKRDTKSHKKKKRKKEKKKKKKKSTNSLKKVKTEKGSTPSPSNEKTNETLAPQIIPAGPQYSPTAYIMVNYGESPQQQTTGQTETNNKEIKPVEGKYANPNHQAYKTVNYVDSDAIFENGKNTTAITQQESKSMLPSTDQQT